MKDAHVGYGFLELGITCVVSFVKRSVVKLTFLKVAGLELEDLICASASSLTGNPVLCLRVRGR